MANATLGRIILAGLGILAYKNRDRLGDIFKPSQTGPDGRTNAEDPKTEGSLFDQLTKSGGLGDILERLRNIGAGGAVDSWVGKGANDPLNPQQVEAVIDEETLHSLSRQTGLSREELLQRLAQNLPETVDELSPEGALPDGPADERDGHQPGLLDPVPTASPKMAGAAQPDAGFSRSPIADRNIDGPREAGATPRPTDSPLG